MKNHGQLNFKMTKISLMKTGIWAKRLPPKQASTCILFVRSRTQSNKKGGPPPHLILLECNFSAVDYSSTRRSTGDLDTTSTAHLDILEK